MSNYRNGSAMERRTKANLERDGYFVIKSAGSKGAADLVAIKAGEILLVQCKLDSYVAPGEWNRLWELSRSIGAVPVVVGRGQTVMRITGPKTRPGARQPWEAFSWDRVADPDPKGAGPAMVDAR